MDLTDPIYTDFIKGELHPQSSPRMVVIGGGLGCGKNSLLTLMQQNDSLPSQYTLHEPDAVMTKLPGYQLQAKSDPLAAFEKWELTARGIAQDLTNLAFIHKYHHVYVRSLSLVDSLKTLYKAKHNLGYVLEIHLVQCSLPMALRRIEQRAQLTGRYLQSEIIVSRYQQLQNNLPYLQQLADRFVIWDNEEENALPKALTA